MLKITKKVN